MKINFYLRPSKTSLKPIKMFVSLNAERFPMHTQLFIEKNKWWKSEQKVNLKKFPDEASRINPQLQKLRELADDLYTLHRPSTASDLVSLIEKEFFKSSEQKLKEERQKEEKKNPKIKFTSQYDGYLAVHKTSINDNTAEVIQDDSLRQYTSFLETIKRYIEWKREDDKEYEFTLDLIDNVFYDDFRYFCLEEEELSPNTFGGKIKRLKTFLYWCQGRDIQVSNKFWDFKVPQSYKDAQPLTGDELKDLWNKDLKENQWKLDILLALCSSGMRISDYNIVMTNMDDYIQPTQNGKALIFKSQKTKAKCVVPLTDDTHFRLKYLYKKYDGKMPKLSGQKLNEFLKENDILPKRIPLENHGSKIGRKSLCSIKCFEQGIEIQHIMPITGHQTEAEFKKYLGVNANTILKANKEKSIPIQKVV